VSDVAAGRDASAVNREFYDQRLPGRDDYWRKMAAPRARVARVLRLLDELRPQSLADLGSGGGQLLEEIHARHPRMKLAGVDLSTAQLAENARRLPFAAWHALDLDAGVDVPPELAGTFDVVVACELIEHLDHPEAFLVTALRLARPATGMLILSTQSGPIRATERHVGHRRHWSRAEMRAALEAAGWKPERVWNEGFPFHDWSKWYANLRPEGTMERFAAKPYGIREDLVCFALRAAFRVNSRRRGAQLFAVARRRGDDAR
jgi:2-polyprenyl-3-methyl-5-hydroxy-6-metoxy-1,4-benzoquinol methylase